MLKNRITFAVRSLGEDGGRQSDKALSTEKCECDTVVYPWWLEILNLLSAIMSALRLGLDGFPIYEPQLSKCAMIMDTTSVLPSISFRRQARN